jgi:ubiquinone/menaquinone biosynthesis C-methylase UbiE
VDERTKRRRAAAFDAADVAAAYAARPDYPARAVSWLVGEPPRRVLDLGAGTGKLTAQLSAAGYDVVVVDPAAEMLAQLQVLLPEVPTHVGTAEAIPLPDASVDAVVAAQAFHWFDTDLALPEIARVLVPGGRLGLVWNIRDDRDPWVAELNALISERAQIDRESVASAQVLNGLAGYQDFDHRTYEHAQSIDRALLLDLIRSRSYAAVMTAEQRTRLLTEVGALFDRHAVGGRLVLPYITHCFRAHTST